MTSGDTYKGEFFEGKIQGQGTYTQNNGNVYIGGWMENQRHGHG